MPLVQNTSEIWIQRSNNLVLKFPADYQIKNDMDKKIMPQFKKHKIQGKNYFQYQVKKKVIFANISSLCNNKENNLKLP
jgi:hypothetical protein